MMSGTPAGSVASMCSTVPRPLDLAERCMNDEELLARNDAREQNRHALAVLAGRVIDSNERTALDQRAALGRDGEVGTKAERRTAAHASVPSWSVIVIAEVTETNRG